MDAERSSTDRPADLEPQTLKGEVSKQLKAAKIRCLYSAALDRGQLISRESYTTDVEVALTRRVHLREVILIVSQ